MIVDYEYYGVEFYELNPDIVEFLRKTFGKSSSYTYIVKGNTIYFYREEDRLIFLLNFD
jgi:hypothetical protein